MEIISTLYVLLFLYAATSKLVDFENFRIQLGQSPVLHDLDKILAWIVPVVETLISATLVFPDTRLLGLFFSLVLMNLFTGYIYSILNFSENIPCSCGGILENMGWQEHLYFNLLFVILAIWAILLHPNRQIAASGG